jgi:hypothetical protein
VSIAPAASVKIEEIAPVLLAMTESQIEAEVRDASSGLRRALRLAVSGRFETFYAPLDWVNDEAKVIIVGVTPGLQQATKALVTLRCALVSAKPLEEAARTAKDAASFKGTMRTLGARLMDHFRLNAVFGVSTCLDLFGVAKALAHYTSTIRYPIMKDGKNYSGDAGLMDRPLLRKIIEEHLPQELQSLPGAWIVSFGPTAHSVIDAMAARGIVQRERVLGGILHPGGQQWNRYNVQLGFVSEEQARRVPGGVEVLRRSAELRAKVTAILHRQRSSTQDEA